MGVTGDRRNACSLKISLKDHGMLMQELGGLDEHLGDKQELKLTGQTAEGSQAQPGWVSQVIWGRGILFYTF